MSAPHDPTGSESSSQPQPQPLPDSSAAPGADRAERRAAFEPASPDVAPVGEESAIPGAHRGGFARWPTAPIGVAETIGPVEPSEIADPRVQWAPPEPRAPYRGLAEWALGFAIVAIVVALFVGWGFPLGLVAIVSAIIALRRPLERRAVAVWSLVIGSVSVLYSAGWLLYAASRTNLLS
jgi:hypothetical protein